MKTKNLLITLILLLSLSLPNYSQAKVPVNYDQDWNEITKVLEKHKGEYKGINNKVAVSGMPDGALLGNGKVGVVGAFDNDLSRFYITTTDFWDGVHLNAKPLPIGGIDIKLSSPSKTEVTQTQDMRDAVIYTDYGDIKVKSWVSATSNMFVSEISTDSKKALTITVETWTHNTNIDKYPVSHGIDQGNIGWASRQTQDVLKSDWISRAALATKVIGAKYTTELADNNKAVMTFSVRAGKKVVIATAVTSEKDILDVVERSVLSVKNQTSKSLETLFESHQEWWKNYWLKSYVRTYDPALESFYFGALYESACAYREGSICPGLFGSWVTNDTPNWNGNCTLSYNHQATVVGFASSNRPELLLPYMQQRYDWEAEGKKRAKRGDVNFIVGNRWGDKFKNGIPGILESITQGPWGSSSTGDLYMGQLCSAVWGSLPITWYCDHTQDKKYIKEVAYPYLLEVANFWEAYLVKENGKWVVKYAGDREWYSNDDINAATTNAYVVAFFKSMINYGKLLEEDTDRVSLWQDIVDNMKDLPSGDLLGKDVFYEFDGGPIKKGDWPGLVMIAGHGNAVTLSSDEKVRQRFINTIDTFDSWEQTNAPGYLWASAVKGGYPTQALLDHFKNLLKKSMRRNFTIPTGGHGTESVSSLEYINCMMLQSHEGFLRLFPAWPGSDAKFVRLRTEGAFLVSASMNNKQIPAVEIFSEKGGRCKVLNPWVEYNVILKDNNGKMVSFYFEGNNVVFDTKSGNTYFLTKSSEKLNINILVNKGKDVQIGTQVWMTKNLDVTTFRNGDIIPEAKTAEEWNKARTERKPAWCYYKNNSENGKGGKLYNFNAISDPRGLAPEGYHIPKNGEWYVLVDFLGGINNAGYEIKNGYFQATIDGFRSTDGSFYGKGTNGYYWSSSVIFNNYVSSIVFDHKSNIGFLYYNRMEEGLSVRCIKD